MAASRRSRAILRPQRPRDTKARTFLARNKGRKQKHQGKEGQGKESERPRSLLLSLGGAIQTLAWVLSWARPGPIPGPRWSRPDSPCALFYSVLDPSRSRGGGHPGPSWSHPAPERSLQDRAWTGRNRLLGHFRKNAFRVLLLREAKPGGSPNRGVSHFFQERSRLCRGPFRDCSS